MSAFANKIHSPSCCITVHQVLSPWITTDLPLVAKSQGLSIAANTIQNCWLLLVFTSNLYQPLITTHDLTDFDMTGQWMSHHISIDHLLSAIKAKHPKMPSLEGDDLWYSRNHANPIYPCKSLVLFPRPLVSETYVLKCIRP
jgi:hypothetical protein